MLGPKRARPKDSNAAARARSLHLLGDLEDLQGQLVPQLAQLGGVHEDTQLLLLRMGRSSGLAPSFRIFTAWLPDSSPMVPKSEPTYIMAPGILTRAKLKMGIFEGRENSRKSRAAS